MRFGEALELLRLGKRIARDSWAKDEFLMIISYAEIRCTDDRGYETSASFPKGVSLWIVKRTFENTLEPWVPRQDDLLASNWMSGASYGKSEFPIGTKVNLKDTGGTWHGVIVPSAEPKTGYRTIEFNSAPANEGYAPGQRLEVPEEWLERS